jgi:hypothetical protein
MKLVTDELACEWASASARVASRRVLGEMEMRSSDALRGHALVVFLSYGDPEPIMFWGCREPSFAEVWERSLSLASVAFPPVLHPRFRLSCLL